MSLRTRIGAPGSNGHHLTICDKVSPVYFIRDSPVRFHNEGQTTKWVDGAGLSIACGLHFTTRGNLRLGDASNPDPTERINGNNHNPRSSAVCVWGRRSQHISAPKKANGSRTTNRAIEGSCRASAKARQITLGSLHDVVATAPAQNKC